MEEDEYKATYNAIASVRCIFEKALTNHHARCSLAVHFCLADREGYSCTEELSSRKCKEMLAKLRENSTFVLKLHEIKGPLPHNMEIRVQAGGMSGLAKLVSDPIDKVSSTGAVIDIHQLIKRSEDKFGDLENLPFSEIIQSVVQFQGRRRKQRK